MSEPLNILVIEDHNADFLMVERHLKQHGLSVRCRCVDSLEGLKEAIGRERWDLVLADYNVPQLSFQESLKLLLGALSDVPVILVSGSIGEEKAVELLKLGVCDFVLKGSLARLVPAIQRSLKDAAKRRAQRAAEGELRESNERLRMIFEHSIDAILLTGTDGRILAANPEACRVFGMSEAEVCLAGGAGLLDAEDTRVFALREELKRAGVCRGELTMKRGDGSRFPAEISSAIFTDRDGLLKTSMIIRDVTQRKNLEDQFLQAQKMEAVGQLAGGVAHDFNNMLSIILGYAELALLRLVPDDPLYRTLQEIRKAGERSATLTRRLLAFSRKQDMTPTVIKLNEAISDQLLMLERLIGEDVRIEFRPSPDLWDTRVDPCQIDQVLTNLAVNARDAIAGVGTVIIETANVTLDDADIRRYAGTSPGDYVCLVFSDTGAGMDGQTVDRIFEPFFTTKEEGKGTGLGLSTVYGIIKQHGGLINVYSEPGMGATFKIYLPRFAGEAEEQVDKPKAVKLSGTETVLLVEDDEQILDVVRDMLEEEGYVVIATSSPAEACKICGEYQGDIGLLISDVVMPTMNGKELQARIAGIKPGIRNLFMSGYTADIIAHRGVIDQGVNFISKPFSLEGLAQKVREAIDR